MPYVPRTPEDMNRLRAAIAANPALAAQMYPGGAEQQQPLPPVGRVATEADAPALGLTVDDIRRMMSNPSRYGPIQAPARAPQQVSPTRQPAVDNAKRTRTRTPPGKPIKPQPTPRTPYEPGEPEDRPIRPGTPFRKTPEHLVKLADRLEQGQPERGSLPWWLTLFGLRSLETEPPPPTPRLPNAAAVKVRDRSLQSTDLDRGMTVDDFGKKKTTSDMVKEASKGKGKAKTPKVKKPRFK